MQWRCASGHEWTTSLNNIKNGKTWCPYCANKASHTIEDAMQVAFGKNGELYCCIEGTNNVHGILIKCCSRNNGLVGCYDQSICGC
ncbi:hypothetical protein RclHR1_07430001 [Rhizophagus clarus]|uniref:Zinc-ribbon domain-containing protein n=1 Tax=Rhizophagus clarus TaxID=94130 RepID=A0A2Z6SLD9_9GLOM|nr:hypothetical protein RclHR1_07430001 [Rhizophagus clarus]